MSLGSSPLPSSFPVVPTNVHDVRNPELFFLIESFKINNKKTKKKKYQKKRRRK